jgi:hypothetical protein
MDAWFINHLQQWADEEFRDDDEREGVIQSIKTLWESDADYFANGTHSYWELLDMARRYGNKWAFDYSEEQIADQLKRFPQRCMRFTSSKTIAD